MYNKNRLWEKGHLVPVTLLLWPIISSDFFLGLPIILGEFGIVYKALLKRSFTENFNETVAVKTLRGFIEIELVTSLLKECAKMKDFDHPNVLKLRGVCLDGGPAPFIIMPFIPNGSLLTYLRDNRTTLVVDPQTTNIEEENVVRS